MGFILKSKRVVAFSFVKFSLRSSRLSIILICIFLSEISNFLLIGFRGFSIFFTTQISNFIFFLIKSFKELLIYSLVENSLGTIIINLLYI